MIRITRKSRVLEKERPMENAHRLRERGGGKACVMT